MNMENKYIYKNQDITVDVIMKIEDIVSKMAEKELRDFDTIYGEFLASRTYTALQNTNSLLWAENAEFIVDEYYREKSMETPDQRRLGPD
jgi:hypothetical protein